MKKAVGFAIYTLFILLLGRSLLLLPRISFFTNKQTDVQKLKQEAQKLVSSQKGSYSVYFHDLKTDVSFGINEKQIHTAASVNKLPIIAVLYVLASTNKISLDEKITIQEKDIQDYGTGKLRYEKQGGVYSLKSLAQLALQESDNTAAHVLATRMGSDVIQNTIKEWGLTQTHIQNNKTSLYDMYLLFQRIYEGKVARPHLRQELLEFLTDTDIEDRLPDLLPSSVKVFHKTGDATGGIHDVGIVEKDGMVYFVGVLASDVSSYEEQTRKTISKISSKIYFFVSERQ